MKTTKTTDKTPVGRAELAECLAALSLLADDVYAKLLAEMLGYDSEAKLPVVAAAETYSDAELAAGFHRLFGGAMKHEDGSWWHRWQGRWRTCNGEEVALLQLALTAAAPAGLAPALFLQLVTPRIPAILSAAEALFVPALDDEAHHQQHGFIALELNSDSRGPRLEVGDVQKCFVAWCATRGEAPLSDPAEWANIDSLCLWSRFRSWIPQMEREVERWRLLEFLRARCETAAASKTAMSQFELAFRAWLKSAGIEGFPENLPKMLGHAGYHYDQNRVLGNGLPIVCGLALRGEDFGGVAYVPTSREPFRPRHFDGATWNPRRGEWTTPERIAIRENEELEAFEATQALARAEEKRISDLQRAFDAAHPPQPASNPNRSQMFAGSYAQGHVINPEAEARREREQLAEYLGDRPPAA